MARYSLTKSQRECFEVIEQLIAEKCEAPSVRELQAALGLKSPGHVTEMLASLKERGWINYIPHKARSIVILPQQGGGAARLSVAGRTRRAPARLRSVQWRRTGQRPCRHRHAVLRRT